MACSCPGIATTAFSPCSTETIRVHEDRAFGITVRVAVTQTEAAMTTLSIRLLTITCILCAVTGQPGRAAPKDATYPPPLPGGKEYVSDTSPDFLKPAASLQKDVEIAKTPPTVEFMYFPGQTYMGNPWSTWGDSIAANG